MVKWVTLKVKFLPVKAISVHVARGQSTPGSDSSWSMSTLGSVKLRSKSCMMALWLSRCSRVWFTNAVLFPISTRFMEKLMVLEKLMKLVQLMRPNVSLRSTYVGSALV